MIEVHWEHNIISFDGRVIEQFSEIGASRRFHIAHVKAAEMRVDKKQRYSFNIRTKGRESISTGFLAPEAIEQAQQLVAEVERVRATL